MQHAATKLCPSVSPPHQRLSEMETRRFLVRRSGSSAFLRQPVPSPFICDALHPFRSFPWFYVFIPPVKSIASTGARFFLSRVSCVSRRRPPRSALTCWDMHATTPPVIPYPGELYILNKLLDSIIDVNGEQSVEDHQKLFMVGWVASRGFLPL